MSDQQLNDNSVVVQGLEPGYVYQFRVVAVDGEYETASLSQDVHTYGTLPEAADRGGIVLASSGWFIGQLLFLLYFLVLDRVAKMTVIFTYFFLDN